MATGTATTDADTIGVFRRFGLGPSALREMMDTVIAGSTMAAGGAGDHMRAMVQELYRDTWAVARYGGPGRVSHSMAGSRPGESWADLIFSFIYGNIMREIYAAKEKGFSMQVPWDGESCSGPRTAPSWQLQAATELTLKMQAIAATVLTSCKRHGLLPNLRLGKTGDRARHARERQAKGAETAL